MWLARGFFHQLCLWLRCAKSFLDQLWQLAGGSKIPMVMNDARVSSKDKLWKAKSQFFFMPILASSPSCWWFSSLDSCLMEGKHWKGSREIRIWMGWFVWARVVLAKTRQALGSNRTKGTTESSKGKNILRQHSPHWWRARRVKIG